MVKSNVNLNYFLYRLHMCQMRSRKSERSHMFQQRYLSSLSATSLVIIIEHTYFISEYEFFFVWGLWTDTNARLTKHISPVYCLIKIHFILYSVFCLSCSIVNFEKMKENIENQQDESYVRKMLNHCLTWSHSNLLWGPGKNDILSVTL